MNILESKKYHHTPYYKPKEPFSFLFFLLLYFLFFFIFLFFLSFNPLLKKKKKNWYSLFWLIIKFENPYWIFNMNFNWLFRRRKNLDRLRFNQINNIKYRIFWKNLEKNFNNHSFIEISNVGIILNLINHYLVDIIEIILCIHLSIFYWLKY